jgi:deazaflavin-dependent oxidoreductase (nitroreductase family)
VTPRRPGPVLTSILRAPTRLYDWHLGWIFGRRFLRLTHTGRRSGRQYQTMLEVVGENSARHEVVVLAGLGRSAQWYRNLVADNVTEVAIGNDRFAPRYRDLDPAEAAAVLAQYERRHRHVRPVIRRMLSWLVGWHYDGTHAKRVKLVSELPMIALRPTHSLTAPRRSGEPPTCGR